MLKLCSIFEDWYIPDGTYPELKKEEKINLAFNIRSCDFEIISDGIYLFEQKKYSEYNFCGKIIYKYSNKSNHNFDIIIVDAKYFKFYMEVENNTKIFVGQFIKGNGSLFVDNYIWVEFLSMYKKSPDIFYNLIIEKILEINIPEKFMKDYSNGSISYPSYLERKDHENDNIKEIEKMNSNGNKKFYLLELRQIDEKIDKTYYRINLKDAWKLMELKGLRLKAFKMKLQFRKIYRYFKKK